MARDYVDIGPAPAGEDCAQVGTDKYYDKAQRECKAFRNQLRRLHGVEPAGARIGIKSNPHDFGTYYEVVCYYDDSIPDSVNYAFKLEGESPELWDDEAKAELAGTVEA